MAYKNFFGDIMHGNNKQYKMGKNYTLVLTEDCNLRCKYCYIPEKNAQEMSINTLHDICDCIYNEIISNKNYTEYLYGIDFIGGEPLIKIDLIEECINYLLPRLNKNNIHISFSAGTNGTITDEKTINIIKKYKSIFGVSVSIDGCKTIHDINRCNSFDSAIKGFKILEQIYGQKPMTKSTLNSEALPYIFESIKYFVEELKINVIPMNTIYEDVLKDGDVDIYKEQLYKVANYLLDNNRYEHITTSLIDKSLTRNVSIDELLSKNWCGSGNHMRAFDTIGNIYPCNRFHNGTANSKLIIGNIYNNPQINEDKLIPFKFMCKFRNIEGKCTECEARAGCSRCVAFDYSQTGSIFDRTFYMCEMHKVRVEVSKYFFNKLNEISK